MFCFPIGLSARICPPDRMGKVWQGGGTPWQSLERYFRIPLTRGRCKGLFSSSLKDEMIEYSFKIKAAGLASPELQRQLRMFDKEPAVENEKVFLEDIPENGLFFAANGRVFRKEDKLRKRYRCLCMRNKRTYLFNPMAEVTPTQEGEKEN
jgi:SprT protein